MPRKIDLTGQKFGRLTVIKGAPREYTSSGRSKVMWMCNCNCGTTDIVIPSENLRSGYTMSCGCLARDLTVQRNKQAKGFNQYDLSGDYGVGYTSNGTRFIFDKEDYHKIYPYRWNVNSLNYITAHDIDNHCKTIYLHRLILNLINNDWKNCQVDHINRDVLDNRKSNLRITNASQNAQNKGRYKTNTSGKTGVSYRNTDKKWIARINPMPNKRVIIGAFEKFEDAVNARIEAEKKYYGQYACNTKEGE